MNASQGARMGRWSCEAGWRMRKEDKVMKMKIVRVIVRVVREIVI